MEIWKDIKGYEGLYQVSSLGRIKSIKSNIILKQGTNRGNYKKVSLSKNGVIKQLSVHQLVALEFIDNPSNYSQVNHIDENKQNNKVNNLEWCNPKYNANYGSRNKRISLTKIKNSVENSNKRSKHSVVQYSLQDNIIKKWKNLREISLESNYKKENIMVACRNNKRTAYGFKWKYIPFEIN